MRCSRSESHYTYVREWHTIHNPMYDGAYNFCYTCSIEMVVLNTFNSSKERRAYITLTQV